MRSSQISNHNLPTTDTQPKGYKPHPSSLQPVTDFNASLRDSIKVELNSQDSYMHSRHISKSAN